MARIYPEIPEETKIKIIEFFKNNDDNRTVYIATIFGVKTHQVDKIINDYLSPKTKSLKT